jgi:RHS repeat-associated protein
MKRFLTLVFIVSQLTAFAQEPGTPIPPKPGDQPTLTPTPGNDIIEQTVEQAEAEINATKVAQATLAAGSLKPGQSPQASPESNLINRFRDIPVNLFTGTPIVGFPIYTLTEPGGASVPIGLSYNASGMRAHDVSSWTGMNWTLSAGGQITRIVRGIPDEGKYAVNGTDYLGTPNTHKGSFKFGNKADNSVENDSQSDIYFLNINGQSYKFIFDNNGRARFFPEADIKLTVEWQGKPNNSSQVGFFKNWQVTMPDGTQYIFAPTGAETETSFEMEANEVINGEAKFGTPQFAVFRYYEETTSAWYLTKIETAFGHKTEFSYLPTKYAYFRLAEQSTTTYNCTFNDISEKINKNFVKSSALHQITNNNFTVEINKDSWVSAIDENGEIYWTVSNSYPNRQDIDSYSRFPTNSSSARALHKISVFDKNNAANILEWEFKYNYNYGYDPGNTVPIFGYDYGHVGYSHQKRFRLHQIIEPDGNKYSFKYYDDGSALPSRLTQAVDHWGFLNGAIGNTLMIGQDAFRVCASNQYANRTATAGWSQYGTLTEVAHSTGSSTVLEYENHQASNYPHIIGGSRVKKITFIDSLSYINSYKTYSYLQDNGESSGLLALKPVYHFDSKNNYSGVANQYWSSSLYEQLLSETGRPAVGYSSVKETVIDQSNNTLGYTKSDFLQPLNSPNIQEKITSNCITTPLPNYPFSITVCDTLTRTRPYKWLPYHDNSIGSPTRIAVYNANNQLLSENTTTYGEGPIGDVASQLGYRSFQMEGQNYNFENSYYDNSKAFRAISNNSKIYSLDGSKPIETITEYIYKDQMPAEYKALYPGKHNQLVKTITTNSLGQQLESLTKYAADFDFGQDSTLVCIEYDQVTSECISVGYEYSPHIPTNTEAKGVYTLLQKHILSGVVESITKQNGNITGASYQTYHDNTALPKQSFGLENIPRPAMTEASFASNTWSKDMDYDLKSTVISYNPIGLPIEVKERFGATSKIDYDATNTLPIKTYKNFGAADQQSSQTEYAKKIFGVSKEIGTNGLEVRKEFYPDGKLKQILDKENNVLSHKTYLYRGIADPVFGTDPTKNRIISRMPRIATTDATMLSYTDCNISITYLDGAGRTMETVAYRASPNAKDMVSGLTEYDNFGRPIKNYLPVESDYDDGRYIDLATVNTKAQAFYGDEICYSEVIYENSPLSRPLKNYGMGKAFRDNDKFTENKYETVNNEANLLKITALIGQNKGFVSSYSDLQIFKKIAIDERGSEVIEYSDKSGNVIRRDVQTADNEYLTTAYVYDDANRLRYTLPPNAYIIIKNQADFDENDPIFNEMIYAYHYDGRGRVYETHTPGTGWSRVVYNRMNQPVLTQDDDEASTNTWNYAQTDGHGRTIRTGQIQTGDSRATLQSYFDSYLSDSQFEERSTAGGNVAHYTNRSFPPQLQSLITEQSLKTVAFYDNYTWLSGINTTTGQTTNYDFQANTLNASAYSKTNATGLSTGGYVKDDLTGDLLLPAVSYYDDKNRSIQSIAYTHLQARDQADTRYNFIGEVLKSIAIYRQKNKPDITRTTSHTYDHVGRPITLNYGLSLYNGGTEFPMNLFNYDPIGRMKTKYIQPSASQIAGSNTSGAWASNNTWAGGTVPNLQTMAIINAGHTVTIPDNASYQAASLLNNGNLTMGQGSTLTLGSMAQVNRLALQTIDYSYNIRSQLWGINLDASGNMATSPEKLFSYKLDYHEDGRYYDGNISKQSWKSFRSPDVRTYTYTYDRSNRVNDASFTGNGNEAYGVSNISYDIMGNLQTMNRNGKTGSNSWGEVDKLTYSYINGGNKLQQIDDNGQNASAGGFINGNSGTDHSYTNAGKITQDLNKGINLIEYNFLDLVKKQTFTDGRIVEYGYTTTGQRRMRKVTKNGQTSYTFYNGEIVYISPDNNIANATIAEIQNAEGRFVGGQFIYGYTDHVGNLRLSYRDSVMTTGDLTSIVVQENAYDVWGNELDGLGFVRNTKDNYLISGKETDSESGNTLLDWRDYDPTTGRMKNPDPAGQFDGISGYSYCANNPVSSIDPDGAVVHILIGAVIGGVINGVIHRNKPGGFWKGFGIGAIAGGIGAATGGAAFLAAGGSTAVVGAGGFLAGMAGGAVGAGTSNLALGLGNNIGYGEKYDPKTLGKDILFGAAFGGVTNGGLAALRGKNFWSGSPLANGKGLFSFGNIQALGDQGWSKLGNGQWSKAYWDGSGTTTFPDMLLPNGQIHQGGTYSLNGGQTEQLLLNPGPTIQQAKHHIFPQAFRSWFSQNGIDNIDDYTIKISKTLHTQLHSGSGRGGVWNSEWNSFKSLYPNASETQIFKHAEDLLQKYHLEFSRYIKYK